MSTARLSAFVFSAWLVALAACGGTGTGDEHDFEDYAELTWGAGVAQQAQTVSGAWRPDGDVLAAGDRQSVDYDGAPPWDGGVNCSGGATPGAQVLKDVLIAAFPQIDAIGIYNCRVIAGTNSMSLHGVGRALDVMLPPVGGDADNGSGDPIAAWLMENAEQLGVQGIIWDHAIWTTSRSPGSRLRAYTGSNPHIDHMHVEINESAGFMDLPWYASPTGPGPAPACTALPADGGIVDDGPCLQLFGPAQYWRTESAGEGGQLYWTNAFVNDAPSNWVRTTVRLATGGAFDVDVSLDPAFARFSAVRYTVTDADGAHVIVLDQASAAAAGRWARLGTFRVAEGGGNIVVVVEDNVATPPPPDARSIVVDAVRARPAPPAPGAAEPPVEPDATEPPPPAPDEPAPDDADEDTVRGPRPALTEGEDGPVLDDDDVGTAEESVIVIGQAPSCAAAAGATVAPMSLAVLLLRRRRRR